MSISYSLFEGRHEIPSNKGAIFDSFDFDSFLGVYNSNITKLKKDIIKEDVFLYVTGLTPALCQLIEEILLIENRKKLILLHYNKDSGEYQERGKI